MSLTMPARLMLEQTVPEGAEMELRRSEDTDKRVLAALTRNVRVHEDDDGVLVIVRPVIPDGNGGLDLGSMAARPFRVVAGDVISTAHRIVGLQLDGDRYMVVRPVTVETVAALRAWDRYWLTMDGSARAASAALVPGY